jgi:hypothetical protein
VGWVILLAGVVGLAAAVYGFAALTVRAVRQRRYVDVALAVAVAGVVVALLIAFGDRLLQ